MLFGYGDISKINYFIDQKEDKERRIAKMHLDALIRYAESYNCRRTPLLNYFGENYDREKCGMCDNCEKEEKDLLLRAGQEAAIDFFKTWDFQKHNEEFRLTA